MEPTQDQIAAIVERALEEDLGQGDVTTDALIPADLDAEAVILAKAEGVVAGIAVAQAVFRRVDLDLRFQAAIADGARVSSGTIVVRLSGRAAGILKAERVALNFLQHLSGIASQTARCVAAVSGTGAAILDTRKTTPGLRLLEKQAVRLGGGRNHRYNLSDGVLIKDNHLAALASRGAGLGEAVGRAREHAPRGLKIEVEVENLAQVQEALDAGADIILLDNMNPEEMKSAVGMIRGRALTEASGGITLENLRSVAETGVDFISMGALTHSVTSLDLSLEIDFSPNRP